MRRARGAVLVVLAMVACGKEKEPGTSAAPAGSAQGVTPSAGAAAPAAKLVPIAIEPLGVVLDMPEGTTLEYTAESKRAHLAKAPLKVNVRAVDQYSPTFEKVSDTTRKGLVKMVRAEQRPDGGFVVIAHAKSELWPEGTFEVDTRTPIGGGLSCGAAADTEALANAVVAACLSLKLIGAPAAATGGSTEGSAAAPAEAPVADGSARPASASASLASRPARASTKQTIAASTAAKASQHQTLMTSGSPSTQGSLPPEVIKRVIATAKGRIRGCYEAGLAKDPKLAGRVSAKIVIGRNGAVSAVAVDGASMPDPKVGPCIAGVLRGLQFPAPMDGNFVTVVYPFVFSPG